MKKLTVLVMAAVAAGTLMAAQGAGRNARGAAANGGAADEKEGRVVIDQFPKTGRASTFSAPSIEGSSILGKCYTKPRKWIVLETKYTTFAKWQDQLTFTWHVLLETKSATENKGNKEKLAQYSYFTTSVTYQNIPQGSHAASVCLPPSYLERFGEPKAIGLVIANKEGTVLAGDCESEIKGITTHPKSLEAAFWSDQKILNATDANGEPMIERRQGLLERSKTIWALVNPNDYEAVAQ